MLSNDNNYIYCIVSVNVLPLSISLHSTARHGIVIIIVTRIIIVVADREELSPVCIAVFIQC